MDTNTRRSPVEMLAEDFSQRIRAGEDPTIEEYVASYPSYAEGIRSLFPVVAALENSKPSKRARRQKEEAGGEAKVLGDYEIVREIGRGGMGVVYEARQRSLGRRVALKVLPANYLPSEKHVLRFKREARSAARLHHTNIVPVFGVGEQDGSHYYVMQYIEGHTLEDVVTCLRELTASSSTEIPKRLDQRTDPVDATLRLAQRLVSSKLTTDQGGGIREAKFSNLDPMADPSSENAEDGRGSSRFWRYFVQPSGVKLESYFWRNVAGIGMQVARALQHAHDQGVLHRDIKPSNLMIDAAGKVWVTDFGLARITDHESLTESHDTVGTLRYMAPEQFRGEFGTQTEIYNLGLTLYEMTTLEPAFTETDHRLLLAHQIAQQPPVRPRAINPSIPRDLEKIILKAISGDPEDRYLSADDLADDLHRFLVGGVIRADRTSVSTIFWRWCGRHTAIARLVSVIAILLATVAVVATIGHVRTTSALNSAKAIEETANRARLDAERKAAEARARIEELETQLRELKEAAK